MSDQLFDDIFSSENSLTGEWVKWSKIGDKIKGTYLRRRKQMDGLRHIEIFVYEIKSPEGKILWVNGKPGIDSQMEYVKPGQIVGMEYVEDRESKKPGFSPTKVINVFANPNIVDPTFVQFDNEDGEGSIEQDESEQGDEDNSVPFPDEEPEMSVEDAAEILGGTVISDENKLLLKISQLAKDKLGATNGDDVKLKVVEATGITFIKKNLPEILEALEALK